MFVDLITNYTIIIPVVAWCIAQLLKMIVEFVKGNGWDLSYMFNSGGMPSSHSAMVSALATTIAMLKGLSSTEFGITVILALIVMYDAAGVRQSVGQQSIVVNRIIKELKVRQHIINLEADLRELLGHTPFQVIAGSAIGIGIAWGWLLLVGI